MYFHLIAVVKFWEFCKREPLPKKKINAVKTYIIVVDTQVITQTEYRQLPVLV